MAKDFDEITKEKDKAQERMSAITEELGGDKFDESDEYSYPYISGRPLRWMYKKDGNPTDVPLEYEKELDELSEKILAWEDEMNKSEDDYFEK